MRCLLNSLRLCSGTHKLFVDRYFRTIGYYSECSRLVERRHNQVTAPSVKITTTKRSSHVLGVQNKEENETTRLDSSNGSDFSSITNNDPILEKKLKILFLEVEVLRQGGHRVPDNVRLDQWKELLQLDTRSKRRKYLSFLFVNEKKRENKKLKKEEQREMWKENLKNRPEENDHITYGLGRNTIFLRIYDTTINHFYNSRLINGMQFNQKIVLDCSYDSYMTTHEAHNCAKQLTILFSDNRIHDSPFDLYLCNALRENITIKQLLKSMPTIYDIDFPVNITEKSYLDLFPKENIVYLTPHCREELNEFDHDAVYIIGAMVDKGVSEPISLAKAKREGLRMAKLPLDRYLLWGSSSSKTLTLNQMVRILLEVRTSGNWNKALEHVPKRKVLTKEDLFQEKFSKKRRISKQQIQYLLKDTSRY